MDDGSKLGSRAVSATTNGLQLGKNIEEIVLSLKNKHRLVIEKEFFSFNYSIWEPFTEKDKQMIKEVF